MRIGSLHQIRRHAGREDGFTMLFALLALFVSSLLVAAAFAAANGDLKLSHKSTLRAKAYYAALAGVQHYQYEMSVNPNYWVKCPSLSNKKVPETPDEEFTFKTLGSTGHAVCEAGAQASILETAGAAKGTFRILSTGTAGSGSEKATRAIVATFAHPGFTQYVYETNYEVEDPSTFSPEPTECAHYYSYRSTHGLTETCPPIQFAPQDKVNGPMHTNDAAAVCAQGSFKPIFGRKGHEDKIEMNGGHYAANGGCSNSPEILGKYTESAGTLEPPETDTELLEAAEYKFKGRTEIELKAGSPNTMKVTTEGATTTKEFPAGGVVYVSNSTKGCAITKYSPFNSNTENDTGCGNVYVHGTYTESLTIASADDVIVNGNLTTTGGETGGEATGGALLGLIAENFVRIYHPVKKGYKLETKVPKSEVATSEENAAKVCGTGFVNRTGTLVSEEGPRRKEITGLSSTTGLTNGMSVEGEYLPSKTTIKLKSTTSVELLPEYPTRNNVKEGFWFYKPNGYEYAPTLNKCVEPPPSGYTFHESELLDVEGSCNGESTYTSKGFCEYENNSGGCAESATNLNASEDPNKWGALSSPVIDAAILSTKHSWIVDNYKCGAKLGELTVWGSIAQYWRGPVGTSGGGGGTGYFKNYNYDQRLAAQQPPNFLSPTSTTWRLSRETEPPPGFTG